jgi:hypothetical protein
LYYPAYYRTLLVRLYNFGGEAYTPEDYTVVRHQVGDSSGITANEIQDLRRFSTYEEALAFLMRRRRVTGDWSAPTHGLGGASGRVAPVRRGV